MTYSASLAHIWLDWLQTIHFLLCLSQVNSLPNPLFWPCLLATNFLSSSLATWNDVVSTFPIISPEKEAPVLLALNGREVGHCLLMFSPRMLGTDSILPWASLGFLGGSAGKESTCSVGDLGLIPELGRSPGEGKGYPLQYSGLENSMDSIVHGVAKSQTRLSDFHLHFLSFIKFERGEWILSKSGALPP